ncbi:MAG: dipeptide ABC transporter periplasmic [Bacteroidetes bacterium]|nr:MAG: dipeptide ABC transporter periplasmic [Bacteroidota bacterium]
MYQRLWVYFAIMLLFNSCRSGIKPEEGKTVFRYNESAGITSLDPVFSRNQANIWAVNQIFNGLVQLDSNMEVKPCIARSWEISGDGTIYTFALRSDVVFHDDSCFAGGIGRVVNAFDVEYSLKRLANPVLAAPGAWVLSYVKTSDGIPEIQAINDSTLRIQLNRPFPPFLGMLGMQYCSVVPHEAIERYGNEFRNHPVGTGPFRFAMWKEGVKLVLLKNESYFEFEDGIRLPHLDAVSVSFIIDKQSAFLEFVKGNLDFMSGIDASYKDELLTPSGKLNPKYEASVNMTSQPYLNTEYLGFLSDTSSPLLKNNPLKDVRVRKALNMSFDRKKMIRYLRNGIGEPGIKGMIPKGMPGYNENTDYGYNYNPAMAAKLLSEAGFPLGKGLPPITLSTNASYLDLCQFIQSEVIKLGIEMKIDVSPPATLRENIAQARIPFFRGSWIADYPDAENYLSLFYSGNHTPAGPNYTRYTNSEFDRLFLETSILDSDSARYAAYTELDSIIMNDAPVIVMFYDQILRFSRANIRGLGSNPMNLLVLKNVKKLADENQ